MKHIVLLLLVLSSPLIFSCEDDPIVEPLTQDDDCVGSYCKLSFPDSIHVAVSTDKNPTLF